LAEAERIKPQPTGKFTKASAFLFFSLTFLADRFIDFANNFPPNENQRL